MKQPLNPIRIIFVMWMLLTVVLPVHAQEDLKDLDAVLILLNEANIALNTGDLTKAQALMIGADALLTREIATQCPQLTETKTLLGQAIMVGEIDATHPLLLSAIVLVESCNAPIIVESSVSTTVDGRLVITPENASQINGFSVLTSPNALGGRGVDWSSDGQFVATGGALDETYVWGIQSGKVVFTVKGAHVVGDVDWSPDGTKLAISENNGIVYIWDGKTGESLGDFFFGNAFGPTQIAWSPDSTQIALARPESIQIWDAATLTQISTLTVTIGYGTDVAWSPDGNWLAFGGGIWDKQSKEFTPLAHDVYRVAWSPDGRLIATGTHSGRIEIWDAQTRQLIAQLDGHRQEVNSIAWSPNSRLIVSGGEDGNIIIWDMVREERLITIVEHSDGVSQVAWSPDGTRFASSSWDQTVRLWEIRTITPIKTKQ